VSNGDAEAVMNSRENFISAPTAVLKKIVAQLGASVIDPYDLYGIPCDKISSAPDLVFKIRGQEFRVTPQEYIRKVKNCVKLLITFF
jgi:hypothetical protein